MNVIKRNIPNSITIGNLVCGVLAIIFVFEQAYISSSFFIFLAAFLDFFDGMAARLLKVSGELGKQLDSLADMVSFGIAPGIILYKLTIDIYFEGISPMDVGLSVMIFCSWIGLIPPILTAIRLAKFNINNNQNDYFIGLPSPAAGITIASVPLIITQNPTMGLLSFIIAICISILLVVNIRFFSFKLTKNEPLSSKTNIFRITLIVGSLILLYFFMFVAIPFIVILYLILSILNNFFIK